MAIPRDKHKTTQCIEEKELLSCMQDQLRRSSLDRPTSPTIFRVPSVIRHVKDAFEPQVISFGPYHHENKELKAMQDHKWWYLSKIISRNPEKGLSDYFEAIKSSIDRARKCYSEKIDMDDDHFAQMLLLDGSFLVELLLVGRVSNPSSSHDSHEKKRFDHIMDISGMTSSVFKDLLKLENQVPFFVLQTIYQILAPRIPGDPSIIDIIFAFIESWCPVVNISMEKPSPNEEIHHLLHFYHFCYFNGRGKPYSNGDPDAYTIPTVKELKEAGVRFKIKGGRYLEVTFSEGAIEMTPVIIYDSFASMFHNLIAFEQCYRAAGTYVTGYSVFLDYLIDSADDVLLLRQARVLISGIGSDKDLAHQVNRLVYNLSYAPPEPIAILFMDINKYRQSPWPRWRAALLHDYFRNPWAIFAFIGAIILLVLAILQTVYTMLSYYRSPSQM